MYLSKNVLVTPCLFVAHACSICGPDLPASVHTHLADSSLQHSIQSSLRCVHVSGDALALDHARELAHVSRHAQDVVEAVGGTTADLIITGGDRWRQPRKFVLIATFKDVNLQNNHHNKVCCFLSPSTAHPHNNVAP